MDFTGKTALVTGAGSGVGQATAVALAQEGLRVVLVGRREEKLRETEAAIRAAGGTGRVYPADVTLPESMERVLSDVRAQWGEVLVLINNAGVHGGFAAIRESDPLRWRDTLLTNLYAPYLLCRLCVPAMLAHGWGRLVNVGSAAGLAPPGGQGSDYTLTKYALNYFTRQMAQELAGTDVSCTVIHPGEVQTEMWEAIKRDAEARGPEGQGARNWATVVEQTGGDPPEKAAALILRILRAAVAEVNGKFLWIEDGMTTPRPTW